MSQPKLINWNQLSELGIIELINRECLHQRGLALCRNPETGKSDGCLISQDLEWEYDPNMKSTIIPEPELKSKLQKIVEEE